MHERVIENWLVNANERQYQRPFCQLLSFEGETILYVSKHGQMELGKDVVSVSTEGIPRAYQMKAGNIGQSELRAIWGELEELVTLDLNYPQLDTKEKHESYLVTNGELTDPAVNHIKEANHTWAKKGLGPLRVIQKDMLLSRFMSAHGSFFPKDLVELNSFFELYVHDGRKSQNKEQLSRLLMDVSDIEGKPKTALDVARASSSVVLLCSYLTNSATRYENHWKAFEMWIVAASSIAAIATKNRPLKGWEFSFELCETAAIDCLSDLAVECTKKVQPPLTPFHLLKWPGGWPRRGAL